MFGGLAVAAGLMLVRSLVKGIRYEFHRVKWLGREGLRLRFALVYTLFNDNDVPATVSRFQGSLRYGDYKLSDVIIGEDRAITVAPGSQEPMEVRFSVSPGALLGEIVRFLEEKSGVRKFYLRGWMSGQVGNIPFKVFFNENLSLAE